MYLSAHRMKIESSAPVNWSMLEKGMVCTFKYKNQKGESKFYMALVLNPEYGEKMHALTLDPINVGFFDSWAKKLGLTFSKRMRTYRKLNVGKLIIQEASKRFYNSEISSQIRQKGGLNFSYRTFWVKDMNSLNVINYGFSFVDDKYLKEMNII